MAFPEEKTYFPLLKKVLSTHKRGFIKLAPGNRYKNIVILQCVLVQVTISDNSMTYDVAYTNFGLLV